MLVIHVFLGKVCPRTHLSATVERLLSNSFARVLYTAYEKQRILHFYSKGYKGSCQILRAVAMASQIFE